ncbi:MAG: ATP-binding protein [Oscillospiraceae bacterium]|nr:ATP-binding protein [Oscillospiraceae bacterium]
MKDSDIKLEDLEKIARGFLFRIGEIKTISEKYFLVKSVNYNKNLELLKKICLETSNYNFGNLATRVNYNFDWDDLVLEKDCKEKLLSICNRIKYKNKIYNDWNFKKQVSYGSGISALFYGPPGTGKTMAAKVIADQVGCELYKIDLSQVIDKYIGETEKNLKSIFDKASKTNVILFFDEADSIFSKRLNISSSNDRYSNIEVSYLLQKIEEYSGVSILATNFLSGFDEAFKRRINFIVNFNIPDKDSRYLIWKKSFPKEASLDENIDFIRLAEKFELTGSSIKSVAVSAAFYSLEDREDKNKKNIIKINHIKKALKDELEKNGKAFLSSDLDIY